jgi:hypothetical protein
MTAVIRRPLEAHLLGHSSISPVMRPCSPPLGQPLRGRRRSTSTPSIFTNADAETLELDTSRPPSVVHSPPPSRNSPKPDIFTSPFAPPPLPSVYAASQRGLWHQRTISPAPACPLPLPVQSRTSMLLPVSAYTPYSIPIQFSASAQRAIYPENSAPYRPSTPRSHPHLRSASISMQPRHAHSLASLSRPRHLSSFPSPSPLSFSESSTPSPPHKNGASAAEIAHALAHGEAVPGTVMDTTINHSPGHWRHSSAPGAISPQKRPRQPSTHSIRKAKVRCPPPSRTGMSSRRQTSIDALVRSALADLLNGMSPGRGSLDSASGLGSEADMGAFEDDRGRSLERCQSTRRQGNSRVADGHYFEADDDVVSRVPRDVRREKRESYVE